MTLQRTVRVTWLGGQLEAALADGRVLAQQDLTSGQPDISRVDLEDWSRRNGSTVPEEIALSDLRYEVLKHDGSREIREPRALMSV